MDAQESQLLSNKIDRKVDSTQKNVDSFKLNIAKDEIESIITYSAKDSIVYDMSSKKLLLYNQSSIDYTDIHIKAFYVDYDWTSSLLKANQKKIKDSIIGKPILKQGDKDYFTERLLYNFKSKQGKVFNIVTQESQAILHGEQVKKDSSGNWYVKNAKITTCTNDTPHFYFRASKMKLTNKKSIVTGPTNIVIREVKTPIFLPFGFFPAQSGRRSGIILPKQYGFSPTFNLRDMGVYFGISEHIDAQLLADIYFDGSYFLRNTNRYSKRYKYNGSVDLSYQRTFNGDADNPAVRGLSSPQFGLSWTHVQDPKSHPTFSFNSSLGFQTAGLFNQSLILDPRRQTGIISSNLNMSKRFRKNPFVINLGLGYSQNLIAKNVSGDFPTARINYNGAPFKIRSNPNHFLNQVNLIYSSEARAFLPTTADSQVFSNQFFDNLKYGVLNTATFNFGGLKLFKYFNFAPNLNYTDRFYFKSKEINFTNNRLDTQVRSGFFSVRDFNFNVGLNTNISGIYRINKKYGLLGFKHLMSPSISFQYTPDFSGNFWNYYGTINRNDTISKYYRFDGLYAGPGIGQSAFINFGINNSIEAKFRNKRDTSAAASKKKMLLDAFSIGGNYNLAADSFKLSNIGIGFSNSTLGFLNFNGTMTINPYEFENGQRIDRFKIGNGGGLGKMTDLSGSMTLNLRSTNFQKNTLAAARGTDAQRQYVQNFYAAFYDFNSPWNLLLSYNFDLRNTYTNLTRRDTTTISMGLRLDNFDFNLTKNWKFAVSSGYDFNTKTIAMTNIRLIRDMHCWEFSIQYTPISNISGGQAYLIEIRPKSGILQDLRLSRNRPTVENYF
jgi:hypothetical protein